MRGSARVPAPRRGVRPGVSHRQRSGEDFDIIIGFLAFWGVILLAMTLWLEITGQPALGWAMGLLAIVLAVWGMLRLRRKLPQRRARRHM